jgi:hypothetical protein
VGVPIGLVGESLVDAVVEVLVVGEDNVAADIVELSMAVSAAQLGMRLVCCGTHEALRSNIGRGKTTGNLVGIDNQP